MQAADCKVDQKHTRDSHNKTRNSLQINKYTSLHSDMGSCLKRVHYVMIQLRNTMRIRNSCGLRNIDVLNRFLRYLRLQSPYLKYHAGIKSRDLAEIHQFLFCPKLVTIRLIQNSTIISFKLYLLLRTAQ